MNKARGLMIFIEDVYVQENRGVLKETECLAGRGNLMLKHSVPHFSPNSGDIAC